MVTRADVLGMLPWTPQADGSFPGYEIGRGTIPGDRISVRSLDALTVNAGELQSGTLHSGDRDGAHISVGDVVYGMQMYNSSKQLMFALSWIDESFRLGLPGQPSVYMSDGDVHIDGDVVIDGSLKVTKIALVGALSRVLLTSDRIQIGTGTWGVNFSGFGATSSAIGGWRNGSSVWTVNNSTGNIVLGKVGSPQNYTSLDWNGIEIANPTDGSNSDRAAITFRSTLDSGGVLFDDTVTVYTRRQGLDLVVNGSEGLADLPALVISSSDSDEEIEITRHSIEIKVASEAYNLFLGQNDFYDPEIFSNQQLKLGVFDDSLGPILVLGIDSTTLNLYGAAIRWKNFTGGNIDRSWAEQPTWGADERGIWYDIDNNVLKRWDGTTWHTIADA
jgi:hypothetical protein